MRIFFLSAIPLIFPALLYWFISFLFIKNKKRFKKKEIPWIVLIIVGAFFAIIFLSVFTNNEKAPPTAKYQPPKYEKGQLIPAKMEH